MGCGHQPRMSPLRALEAETSRGKRKNQMPGLGTSAPVRWIWVRISILPPKSCPERGARSGASPRVMLPPLYTETCLLCATDRSSEKRQFHP